MWQYRQCERGNGETTLIDSPDAANEQFPASEKAGSTPEDALARNADQCLQGNGTVLLVEDEEMLRNLIATLLQSHGYSVITADNGIEALEQFKKFHKEIAVVLTDIGLPKMSGWDAFRAMKNIDPNVKAIFASGYLDQHKELVSNGAKHFVQKPYVPSDLLKKLRETIADI